MLDYFAVRVLPADMHKAALKIHIAPAKPKNLPFPHAGRGCDPHDDAGAPGAMSKEHRQLLRREALIATLPGAYRGLLDEARRVHRDDVIAHPVAVKNAEHEQRLAHGGGPERLPIRINTRFQ